MATYLNRMDRRFRWLAENAGAGRSREELASGLRSFPEGGHLIFYQAHGQQIRIVRVLHSAMDLGAAEF